MYKIYLLFYAIINFQLVLTLAPSDVLFLISGQDSNSYHRQLSETLRKNIKEQALTLKADTHTVVRVHLLNELFSHPGDWTLLSTLSHLYDGQKQFTQPLINENTKWIILCEESTHVELQILLDKLSKENSSETAYYGFPLYDQEATIIHHFAFFENPKWFPYPMLRAGVVFTVPLLKSLAASVAGQGIAAGTKLPIRTTDFSIDAAHELARFILNHIRIERDSPLLQVAAATFATAKGQASARNSPMSTFAASSLETTSKMYRFKNVRKMILQRASYICPKAPTDTASRTAVLSTRKGKSKGAAACAMYAKPMDTTSCIPIKRQEIFVAIKTCQKFHTDRIPVIEATWAPYVAHKRYYSDIADASIPTIDTGIPNAETGHCSKTLAILKLALKDIEQMNRELKLKSRSMSSHSDGNDEGVGRDDAVDDNSNLIRWLLLSDDDTLLSISHMCDFLGCFNHTEMVYLGERYGYRLHAEDGFNYITGGGGIVFSLPVVNMIIKHCTCPSNASPDDMILGACLDMLGIKALHSTRFHQARPNDYPRELLQLEPPISFHKFWQLDPLKVYEQWFAIADREMLSLELLQSKAYQQSTKLRIRLKEIANTKNKSRYAAENAATKNCESRTKEIKSITTKMENRNQLPLAMDATAFQHETASHLDL